MIDELYAVHLGLKDYDIVDFEDGNHLVIDGRKVYRVTPDNCSCGFEGDDSECLHIKAIHRYYREIGD